MDDVDAELAGLASLAEEAAAEISAATTKLAEPAEPNQVEATTASSPEPDAPSATQEPEAPTATRVAEAAATDEPDPGVQESAAAATTDAASSSADKEIDDFLEAADAGKSSAAPPKLVFKSTPTKKPKAESAPDDSVASDEPAKASQTGELRARLIAGLAEKLESILAKLDAPVAGLRDEVKAIIGYLALGTFVMAMITWVVATFR